jgi:hypothetical protein
MAMRETVRSLRAYFIVSGLASLFYSGSALLVSLSNPVTVATALFVVSIGFSLAFVYVGFSLVGLLRNFVTSIVMLLYISAGWSVFVFLLSLLGGLSPASLGILVITLLILWYLLKNVKRLAAEAQIVSSGTTPSGPTNPS